MKEDRIFEKIAAYLPYKLGVIATLSRNLSLTGKLIGLDTSSVLVKGSLGVSNANYSNISPLLHPMERLNNGEYLIAGQTPCRVIHRYFSLYFSGEGVCEVEYDDNCILCWHEEVTYRHVTAYQCPEISAINRFLLRHHFDIHNLIDQGYATPK